MNIRPSQTAVSAGLSSPSISTVTDVAHQPLPGRFLLDRVKDEAAANALARADRREEADPVEAVVDGHLQPFGNEHRLGAHAREQRQRKEAVRDRPAERRLRRGRRIDVNELPVLGRVGEGVDPGLVDNEPGGDADLVADTTLDSVSAASGMANL